MKKTMGIDKVGRIVIPEELVTRYGLECSVPVRLVPSVEDGAILPEPDRLS